MSTIPSCETTIGFKQQKKINTDYLYFLPNNSSYLSLICVINYGNEIFALQWSTVCLLLGTVLFYICIIGNSSEIINVTKKTVLMFHVNLVHEHLWRKFKLVWWSLSLPLHPIVLWCFNTLPQLHGSVWGNGWIKNCHSTSYACSNRITDGDNVLHTVSPQGIPAEPMGQVGYLSDDRKLATMWEEGDVVWIDYQTMNDKDMANWNV